ncbi:hypothetical protein CMUS01_08195 [Colletotrichum musicola]|uniref:Uncharacterized protein n=1 Tax=Colletotrichum musicola TaxID=2175873 RepID=A0A8H6KD01_9PEZI|nr:hypothetical protein CMUS01_08195 [Colletotrichum musicola]
MVGREIRMGPWEIFSVQCRWFTFRSSKVPSNVSIPIPIPAIRAWRLVTMLHNRSNRVPHRSATHRITCKETHGSLPSSLQPHVHAHAPRILARLVCGSAKNRMPPHHRPSPASTTNHHHGKPLINERGAYQSHNETQALSL